MNKNILLISLMVTASYASSIAQWNKVQNISVSFKIKNAGITVDGKFNQVSAKIEFNEKDYKKSNFSGRAEVSSISTGIALRDKHLREKENFFNEIKYPVIQMNAVSITEQGNGDFQVLWDITMKGITRRFSSVVKSLVQNATLMLATELRVNRNYWNIGGSSITIGDMVTIKINALISK